MKIVVCVKQVPEVSNVQIDSKSGTLMREGVQSILNPFCEYALDQAVRLARGLAKCEVIALTMGPKQAESALLRCLELGADRAYLISDRKFAGADTWATSRTIAETIRHVVPDFNLILMGKQAIDGDTAQVGPEVAEILTVPQITYAVDLSLGDNNVKLQAKRECEDGYEIIETSLPALITVSRGESVRRIPSFNDYIEARQKPLEVITANDLSLSDDELGLSGSYTQVVKVFAPKTKQQGRMVYSEDAGQAAKEIFEFIKMNHSI